MSCPQDHGAGLCHVTEQLLSQIDRYAGHTESTLGDGGRGMHGLARGKGGVEETVDNCSRNSIGAVV